MILSRLHGLQNVLTENEGNWSHLRVHLLYRIWYILLCQWQFDCFCSYSMTWEYAVKVREGILVYLIISYLILYFISSCYIIKDTKSMLILSLELLQRYILGLIFIICKLYKQRIILTKTYSLVSWQCSIKPRLISYFSISILVV